MCRGLFDAICKAEVKWMPSEKVLAEKQQIVAELAEKLKRAVTGVLVDYKGINVANDTKLRAEFRREGVDYSVQKNTLVRLAAREAGLIGLDKLLKGTTAIAMSETDLVAPAKIIARFTMGKEKLNIKGGFIEGKVVNQADINELAKLPPKEVLIARVLGGFNATISGFANVLRANLTGLVRVLNAYAEKQAA
jgi:large subunit ribosomal protein L10